MQRVSPTKKIPAQAEGKKKTIVQGKNPPLMMRGRWRWQRWLPWWYGCSVAMVGVLMMFMVMLMRIIRPIMLLLMTTTMMVVLVVNGDGDEQHIICIPLWNNFNLLSRKHQKKKNKKNKAKQKTKKQKNKKTLVSRKKNYNSCLIFGRQPPYIKQP